MNVLCNGVDIGCTGVTSQPAHSHIEWRSLEELSTSPPPPGKYSVRLEFTGPVDPGMPTEGVHSFEFRSMAGVQTFRAEAEHIPAHKEKGARVAAPCPVCDNEECCNAVWENYEIDVPAKTYWNVLNEKAEA
jgi:hypothetical protein